MATSSQTIHWVGVNNAYDLLLALSDPDADERRFSDHHTRADVAEALSIIDREANELRDDESLKDYDVPGVIDALWRKFTPMLAVDHLSWVTARKGLLSEKERGFLLTLAGCVGDGPSGRFIEDRGTRLREIARKAANVMPRNASSDDMAAMYGRVRRDARRLSDSLASPSDVPANHRVRSALADLMLDVSITVLYALQDGAGPVTVEASGTVDASDHPAKGTGVFNLK